MSKKTSAATEPAVQPHLLNVQQAAVYLGTTVWCVRNLVWKKELRALRIGHRLLCDRADLDAYVEILKRAA